MTLTQTNFTSNLQESVFNKLKEVVGTSYTHPTLGVRTITYSGAYPADMEAYRGTLPLIILTRGTKPRPVGFSQGGPRKYTDQFNINIIAGGYDLNNINAYMKNALVDLIQFGFDERRFNLTNIETSTIEGQYQVNCYEVPRIIGDHNSVYERAHAQMLLTTWVTLTTNR